MAAQPLSEFARRYGPWNGTSHSKLTPLEYSFPRYITDDEAASIQDRENYQVQNLHTFTTQDLVQQDVITDRKLKDSNLQNGIHPLMTRDRWENAPPTLSFGRTQLYTVRGGTGLWSSDNDEVWRVLEPCLKLATRTLLSMHTLGWVIY